MKKEVQLNLSKNAEAAKQQAWLGTVLALAFAMAVGTVQVSQAGTTLDANLAANIVAGTLALDTGFSQLNFNAGSPGQTIIANSTTSGIVANDTRGSLAGWDVTGFFNTDFYSAATPADQMAIASRMGWFPQASTITAVTGDSGGAVSGTNNNFAGTASGNSLRLMNSDQGTANNGAGAYNLTNLKFNYSIPVSATPHDDYKVNLRLTIT